MNYHICYHKSNELTIFKGGSPCEFRLIVSYHRSCYISGFDLSNLQYEVLRQNYLTLVAYLQNWQVIPRKYQNATLSYFCVHLDLKKSDSFSTIGALATLIKRADFFMIFISLYPIVHNVSFVSGVRREI